MHAVYNFDLVNQFEGFFNKIGICSRIISLNFMIYLNQRYFSKI